jgi:hypothetical protein
LYNSDRYADLGSEVLGRRVTASVVGRNVDEAVDIVLGNSIGNTLDTVDVDILVGEVPGVVRNHIFIYITHCNSLGGILATDKVVDNIGVTNALLDGLGVAQVVFLYRESDTFPDSNKLYSRKTPYHEHNSSKITSDLQVSLGHLLTVGNDNGATLASCGPLVYDPIAVQQTLNLPSLLTM